jgi:uncharacterized protein YjbI with pentapeptide repeats
METIEIKDVYSDLLFTHSCKDNTLKKTIEEAINQGVDLSGADLSGANLSGTDLCGGDLSGGDLSGADLTGADLRNVNLRRTNLSNAKLRGANLKRSNLRMANLSNADLARVSLSYANLSGVKLSGANLDRVAMYNAILDRVDLRKANLRKIKMDFYKVLDKAKPEVEGLKQALLEGRVDGTVYKGECACLIGTIAHLRGASTKQLEGIIPNASRPIEEWFYGIREKDTPETNQFSAIAVEWIDEYLQK